MVNQISIPREALIDDIRNRDVRRKSTRTLDFNTIVEHPMWISSATL